MTNIELLFREYRRSTPISLDEFIQAGWTLKEFVEYQRRCEVLRTGIVYAKELRSILVDPDSKESIKAIQAAGSTLQAAFDGVAKWLEQYFDCEIESFQTIATSNVLPHRYTTISINVIPKVYIDSDEFRFHLERFINLRINNDLHSILGDDLSLISNEKLEEEIRLRRRLIEETREPDNPNFDSYYSVQQWASKMEEYDRVLNDFYEYEIEELEQQIEKNNRSFNPIEDILYIYAGTVECLTVHSSNVESITANIKGIDDQIIKLNVNYCPECNIFFIKQSEYERYREIYKFLPIRMRYKTRREDRHFFAREEYSFLALAGYSVSKAAGLSSETRHRILEKLIESGYSKYEIMNHLDMLIATNGSKSNMGNANRKWLEDLDFVRQYYFEKQRQMNVKDIRSGAPSK